MITFRRRNFAALVLLGLLGISGLLGTGVAPARAGSPSDSPWTDWYRHGLLKGGTELIKMRKWLDTHNLFDTTVARSSTVSCDSSRIYVRTADGTCNNLADPLMGAAGVRFGRNVPVAAIHAPSEGEVLDPNPRQISLELLRRDELKTIPNLNLLAGSWIQFMVHDWLSHGENESPQTVAPFILPLAATDPLALLGQKEMLIFRTQIDRSRTDADSAIPVSYRNEVTHWWDGSQLYGSDQETQNKLRSFKDGMLRLDEKTRHLPLDRDGIEAVGFKRNWWTGLSVMHELFALEHNSIAARLKASYPHWDDQTLFDHARLINVAVMAKIHTVEWTPSILTNPILKQGMEANWYGFNSQGGKRADLFKFMKNPVFDGIVGGKNELNGVPYTITEEFTSVYRLHSLLPEALAVRSERDGSTLATAPLAEMRDENAHRVTDRFSSTDLFYSIGSAHAGALTLGNYPRFMQELELPGMGKVDMATMDLIRDRERGVPRYNEFRRLLDLKPLHSIAELTDDPVALEKLMRLYRGDIEKVDLMVGCLAESVRPTGYSFGETQFQIFLLMATRRLQADRFFTTDYRPEVYTPEGIAWVKKASMKSVLIRHYPGLARHLEGLDTAFRPWR